MSDRISLREAASQLGVSHAAMRNRWRRHGAELLSQGLATKVGNKWMLDPAALHLLTIAGDTPAVPTPSAVELELQYAQSEAREAKQALMNEKDQRIRELEAEVSALRAALAALAIR